MNNKLAEWRAILDKCVENYQSTRAWYEENRDSPAALDDMERAKDQLTKFVRKYGFCVVLDLLDEIDELQERRKADNEPVMYQTRTRPTWNASQPWSLWSECSAESYKETMRFATEPDGAGWVYEGRILHAALPVPEEIKHHIGGQDWGWEGEFNRGWNACRTAMLQAGNSPVIPDGWIKCSDQMPKTGQTVIGCIDFDSDIVTPLVGEFIWTGSTFRRGYSSTGVKSNDSIVVTHWMPLPAAPKKD